MAMKTRGWLVAAGVGMGFVGTAIWGGSTGAAPANPDLEIGIVQRFGESSTDRLNISTSGGAHLVMEYDDASGEEIVRNVPAIAIGIHNRLLDRPFEDSRLILSSHRSFESAAASAEEWEARGVRTLVVQPDEWQVWAHPEEYTLTARLEILERARAQNRPGVRLERQLISTNPELSWTILGETFTDRELQIRSSNGSPLTVNGKTYAGTLTLQPNTFDTYTLVNTVPLETYLRGVVPHEIGPGAPFEAIKAQAILARTYALQNRHRFTPDNYELCADTQCQVYRGLSGTIPSADRAIASTAGLVLTFDGQLADAVYSSTTGGITAAFNHIWDGDPRPYLQPIPDTLLLGQQVVDLDLTRDDHFRRFLSLRSGFNETGISNYFRWEIPQPLPKLTHNLQENQKYLSLPFPPYQSIASLEILERSPSGRVQALKVNLRQADSNIIPVTLRKDAILLGLRATYSLLFTVDPIASGGVLRGYNFSGGGLGHGVGMSQYGSYHLARQGYRATDILAFYYPGTTLTPLTPALAALWPAN
ncbi:SpoIID/LytB domain-containing protein [Synechococcus sp. PCC 7336]|uniref:SpoIID/LytB domain-containing protein n=1 Tax=Synechococcus sp. PCC 7336 TaxID=195250 RepID=UPI00036C068B|nr:SpoIID/LytB domain-containing protein [Synechococcus sp. PCC 7336]